MSPARIEQLSLDEIFSGQIPSTIGPLFFTLGQLSDTENTHLEESVRIIYEAYKREVPDSLRRSVFLYLVQEVESGTLDSAAILAVVRFESNHFLVNRAVAAFLRLKPASFETPFAAISIVLDLIQNNAVVNRGAAFAGLICFGDRRVCAVARTIRENIELEDAREFSRAATGPLQRPTIEFCMEWLLDLMSREHYELAIQVAYALSSMVINDSILVVHDKRYNFGPYCFTLARRDQKISYGDLLDDLSQMIASLAENRLPAINRMMEILKDPASETLDRLDQRKVTTRRLNPDRRVSDRRIVNISPRIERRTSQRRGGDRRVRQRR